MEEFVRKLPQGIGYDWTGLSYQERQAGAAQRTRKYARQLKVAEKAGRSFFRIRDAVAQSGIFKARLRIDGAGGWGLGWFGDFNVFSCQEIVEK